MKTEYVIVLLVLAVLFVAAILYQGGQIQLPGVTTTTVGTKGTLILAVKDVPRHSEYGTITSIFITFSEVSVHKAAVGEDINTTKDEMATTESNASESGWITVVDRTQTVDLLQLIGLSKILGEKDLDAGRYSQIRLKIESANVTINAQTYSLKIPSRYLKLNRGFVIEQGVDLKLTLDFKTEKSVVKAGDKFILKPVIEVLSEVIGPIATTSVPTTAPETTALTTVPGATTAGTSTIPITTNGILVMKITDKLSLTNITEIKLIINKVEVHKAGEGNETESNETLETNSTSSAGWVTIVDEIQSFDLLELAGTPGKVMGNETLSPGKYTQIRLFVSEAKLTSNNVTYDVKVPSKRFYWIKPFSIEAGKVTTLTLDFDAAESVKETGKNNFLLKPTVKILSEMSVITTTTTIPTTVPTTTTSVNATTTTSVNTTSTTVPTTSTTASVTTTSINATTTTSETTTTV